MKPKRQCGSLRRATSLAAASVLLLAPAATEGQRLPAAADAGRHVYELAQAGRYAEAARIVQSLNGSQASVRALTLRLLLERRAFADILSAVDRSSGHLAAYAVGLAAAHSSQSSQRRPSIDLATMMLASLDREAGHAGRRSIVEIERLSVQAAIAAAQEEREEMALVLAHAIDLERDLVHDRMPALPVPVRELAGDLWLEVDREHDARREYTASLAAFPGRARSLLGLARASARAGDAALATDAYRTLLAWWVRADHALPELGEAATHLGFITP
jgi:hypothetical protein